MMLVLKIALISVLAAAPVLIAAVLVERYRRAADARLSAVVRQAGEALAPARAR